MNQYLHHSPSFCRYVARSLLLSLTAFALVSADPAPHSKELVRAGNQAFLQDLFDVALERYEQAELRITDPGLVAYNKAVTLYRLGRFREAELHFRRSAEGTAPDRFRHSLFGLGNALVMQDGGTNLQALEYAVETFRLCKRQPNVDKLLLAKINHNLELARLLLIQAKEHAKENPQPNPNNGDKTNGNSQTKNGSKKSDNKFGKGKGKSAKTDADGKGNGKAGKTNATDKPLPGKGGLRTLPDDGDLVPLDGDDARRLLQQAIRRIEQQRRQDRQARAPAAAGVKDW